MKTINYGIGKEYLPKWGLKEALREIYQNFLDYDDGYTSEIEGKSNDNTISRVSLNNGYIPDKLEFLRIGNSMKTKTNAIGKHGEGLKMALLIFAREGYFIEVTTSKYVVTPRFEENPEVGSLFVLDYVEHGKEINSFTITFGIEDKLYNDFINGIIAEKDVLFENRIGRIVDKPKGDIYSGGLFVTNWKGLSKAYDFNPEYVPLDRDRSTPRGFDVEYYASQIISEQGEFKVEDLGCRDLSYVNKIPDSIREQVTPTVVGNKIEFVVDGEVIKNDSAVEVLKRDSFFKRQIDKLKLSIMKGLGLYALLEEFEKNHVHGSEAEEDFNVIMNRVKSGNYE